MGIGAFGRTLLSEFANNSPRGASLERTISCGSTTVAFQCPLLAQSGHHDRADPCPLLGVKRTLLHVASSHYWTVAHWNSGALDLSFALNIWPDAFALGKRRGQYFKLLF